jgi:hypothetical protein
VQELQDAYEPEGREKEIIEKAIGWSGQIFKHNPRAAPKCNGSGYKGRVGIHELMVNNEELTEGINKEVEVAELKRIAMKTGMKTLHQDSMLKVKMGLTTMEEALANVPPDLSGWPERHRERQAGLCRAPGKRLADRRAEDRALPPMVRIRRFEERSLRAYQAKKIGGFLHLYIGQEAVAVGCCSLMGKDDHVITAYRDHGHAIAVGMELNPLMAELYGKATGCSKGKGGSMHFFDPSRNYWGGHGIVGGQVPLGTGSPTGSSTRA